MKSLIEVVLLSAAAEIAAAFTRTGDVGVLYFFVIPASYLILSEVRYIKSKLDENK